MSPSPPPTSETASRKAAGHYRSVFKAMLNGVAYCKVLTDGPPPHDFVYIEVNEAFETLTGLTDVEGKRVSEVIPGIRESDPWLLNLYSDVAESGKPQKFERYVEALKQWFAVSVYSPAPGYFVAVFDVTTKARVVEEALLASDAKYQRLFRASHDAVVISEMASGRIVEINERFSQLTGCSRAELVGKDSLSLGLLDASTRRRLVEEAGKSGSVKDVELEVPTRSGGTRTVLLSGEAVLLGGQQLLVTSLHDITERNAATASLRASEDLFRVAFENASVGKALMAPDGRPIRVNQATCAMLGYSAQELVTRNWREFTHPDDVEATVRAIALATATPGEEGRLEKRYIRKDGSVVWADASTRAVHGPEGVVKYFITTLIDITDRKRAEEALRAALLKLESHIAASPFAVVEWGPGYTVRGWSPRAEGMFGWSAAEVVGKRIDEIPWVPDEDWASVRAVSHDMETGARPSNVNANRNRRKDGRIIHCEWHNSALHDESGKLVSVMSMVEDVTARVEAEVALRESEARFRALADSAPIGIFLTDASSNNIFLNRAGERLMGLTATQARGGGWSAAIHPEDRNRVYRAWTEAAEAGRDFSSEYRFLLKDGRVTWVRGYGAAIRDLAGKASGYVGAFADFTEHRALQARLALASRLAAMGTLVAGVAHEINNPLSAELSDQGLAMEVLREIREDLEGGSAPDRRIEVGRLDEAIEALREAQECGQRISQIVMDMAAFASPNPKRAIISLADIVRGAMRRLPASVGQAATIELEDRAAPQVMAAPGQLEQVVQNLITNAARAIPKGGGRTIIVRIGPGSPGMARLDVIDEGCGVDPADMDRIFEPFYTTRPVGEGRGTGLGLAICQSIVSSHGGTITVESEVGKGSTFRVELPATPAEA